MGRQSEDGKRFSSKDQRKLAPKTASRVVGAQRSIVTAGKLARSAAMEGGSKMTF
jgi:hypothetical protein